MVLARTENPANVGAVARIVRNVGFAGLDLVAPGDWRTVECWRTAWGAQDVLEQAREHPDLAAALAGTTLAVAFTGKRDRDALVDDVREAAAAVAACGPDDTVALVFGSESSGLTREEMAACGRRATISTDPGQPSLNVSHAVMVAAYEVFRAAGRTAALPRRASHDEKERLLALLREGLIALEALPRQNREGHFLEWRNLFQRMDLTPRELNLLEHLARKMAARR